VLLKDLSSIGHPSGGARYSTARSLRRRGRSQWTTARHSAVSARQRDRQPPAASGGAAAEGL